MLKTFSMGTRRSQKTMCQQTATHRLRQFVSVGEDRELFDHAHAPPAVAWPYFGVSPAEGRPFGIIFSFRDVAERDQGEPASSGLYPLRLNILATSAYRTWKPGPLPSRGGRRPRVDRISSPAARSLCKIASAGRALGPSVRRPLWADHRTGIMLRGGIRRDVGATARGRKSACTCLVDPGSCLPASRRDACVLFGVSAVLPLCSD